MTETKNLTREVPFTVTRDDSDGLTLDGYAAVFGTPTQISGWEGDFDEIMAAGCFKRTIDLKGPRGIRLQFDHGNHPLVGSIPIGTIDTLEEDARGLHVVARLHDNWLTQPVRDCIREGSVSGMSFRFRVVKEEWDESGDDKLRTIREVELYEVGPVVWPAYKQTSVSLRAQQIRDAITQDSGLRADLALLFAGTPATPDSESEPDAAPAIEDHPRDQAPALTADERQEAFADLFNKENP